MLLRSLLACSALLIIGCQPSSESSEKPSLECSQDAFKTLLDHHFEQYLSLHPLFATAAGHDAYDDKFGDGISDSWLKQRNELNTESLSRAQNMDSSCLSASEQAAYQDFIRSRQLDLVSETFPERFLPINQFYSPVNTLIQYASGESAQRFDTLWAYQNFQGRSSEFSQWVDLAIERMKEGIESEVVLPRVLSQRIVDQLDGVLNTPMEQSILMNPKHNASKTLQGADIAKAAQIHQRSIEVWVWPALERLNQFLKSEYMQNSRASDGYWGLPNGRLWYKHYVNSYVDDQRSLEQIHQLGISEVARIHEEMKKVGKALQLSTDLPILFRQLTTDPTYYYETPEALVAGYEDLKSTIDPVLPQYFASIPEQPYEVRRVEPYREANEAGASYQSAPPSSGRPGIFYINAYNLRAQPKWGMVTLSLHEAAPGHHFQIAQQLSLPMISEYLRYSSNTAFDEGWALYAEYLGIEMGLLDEPLDYFGKLSDELLRAMRLVVDTGLHDKGWTREQAIQYMQDNSPLAPSDVVAEVERYMAIPGQAVSYKLGEQTILELRRYAETELGDQFVLSEFHQQVLKNGSMSMPVLTTSVKNWVDSQVGLK